MLLYAAALLPRRYAVEAAAAILLRYYRCLLLTMPYAARAPIDMPYARHAARVTRRFKIALAIL